MPAEVEEVIDEARDEGQESEENDEIVDSPSQASSSRKKKKKKSKAAKALGALTGQSKIPQALVDRVLDQVKAEGVQEATEDNVRQALEEMKIVDVVKGKAGIGGINKKDLGEHKAFHPCLIIFQKL